MELKVIAFVCLLVSSVVCNEEDNKIGDQEENFPIVLGNDNFADTIKTNSFFVMFYAPWCHHCKKLKPIWNDLAELINTQDESRVKVAMVDCVDHHATCSENEITSYPTLKFFKLGTAEPVKYRSTRDLPSFTQFINDQIGSSVTEEEGGEKEEPAVPVPQKGLIELNDKNFNQLTENGPWFIKFYAPWCGHCQKMAPTWNELATSLEYDNTVNVAKIDCTEYRPICKDFDVKGFPTILWLENGKKVDKYSGPRTVEDFKAYIEKRLETKGEGEEKPKEEAKTLDEGEGSTVLQLSGENFHQVIEKDLTFVALTASWCGHCKRLAPTFQQLAEKYVGNEKVKIAKVDCSINENRDLCTEQEVNGYPTIFIYKNGKKISEYNGNRGLEDMFDFVKSHMEDEKARDEL